MNETSATQANYEVLKSSPPRREEDLSPFAKGNVLLAKTLMYFAAPVTFGLALWRLQGLFYEANGWWIAPAIALGLAAIPFYFDWAMGVVRRRSIRFLVDAIYCEGRVTKTTVNSAGLTMQLEYRDRGGKSYQGKAVALFSASDSTISEGSTLPVLYSPEKPDQFIAVAPEVGLIPGKGKAIG